MADGVVDSVAPVHPASWGMDGRLRNIAQFGAVGVLVLILGWMMYQDDKDNARRIEAEDRLAAVHQRHSDRLVDVVREGQAREAANAEKIAKSHREVAKAINDLRVTLIGKAPAPMEIDMGLWGSIKREIDRIKAGDGG